MANIITTLALEMSANWYVSKKLNSIGRVGENTVTKLIIEPTEILDNVTYEIEIMSADGSKNVAELTVDGTELYLILTANMLTTSGITKMQVRGLFTDGSIKKSNIFELKVNRSISATEAYEEYSVTIFDQLVQDCRDIIEGAESYAVRAETAATNAEAYEQSASASASTASTASTAAVNAATSAESASTSAHTSAETATTAAASASTSASNASTSATNAANSAVAAATSATNAHNSEVNASASETNAGASAAEAEASAESIAASVAQINENTYRINDLEAIIGGYQLTDLPTGAIATVTDGTALLMPSLKIGIEPVQSGSGDPSPENIRPISGWAAANVTRTGKNLTDGAVNGYYIDTDGTLGNLSSYRCIDYVNIDGVTKLKATVSTTYPNFWVWRIASYDINKNFIELSLNRVVANGDFEEEVTLPSNAKFIRACAIIQSTDWNIYNKSTYSTYTIQFTDGDNPLTVYGGTLNAISGLLTITDVFIASYNGETLPSTWISDRDVYAEGTTPTTGAEVVYKLANSVTYQLTPTQIRTLVGTNNIWADTGDIIEGKYFRSLT